MIQKKLNNLKCNLLKSGFSGILILTTFSISFLAGCPRPPKKKADIGQILPALLRPSATAPCSSTSLPSTNVTPATTCSISGAINKTETLYSGGPSCTTNISSDAPCWMKENFHCVTITISGTDYKIVTNNLPPYLSAYYSGAASNSSFTESMGSGRTKNPNTISSQSITMTIPQTPTCQTNLDVAMGQGLDVLGITTYGVAIFNNQAAPGDSLATEYQTMDQSEGHPQNTGKYHHHTEPYKLTTSLGTSVIGNDNGATFTVANTTSTGQELIGIMLDGYPIYGKKAQDGTTPSLESNSHTRQCTTTHFPGGTYCYHVGDGTGVASYMIGSFFRGKKGTVN
ncbi:MAG: YHYH protein [Leptospira sp.]|nr:YHYH protein [Leptospira sp.]